MEGRIKTVIRFAIYYILGYLIFNIFVYIAQLLIHIFLGLEKSIMYSFIECLKNTLAGYTILYIIIMIIYFVYSMFLVKKLNEKLKKIKREGGSNEK